MNSPLSDRLLDHVHRTARRGNAASVIQAIDGFAGRSSGMIHLGADKGAIFDEIVSGSGAKAVLELGTNYGYSALRMAQRLDGSAKIHTVEIDHQLNAIASAIFSYAGVSAKIETHCGAANQVVAGFTEPFDLIFIDHYPENYLIDLQQLESLGLIAEGATVISDNVLIFERQLGAYLHHLRSSGIYLSTLHRPPNGNDGMEVSTRISRAA